MRRLSSLLTWTDHLMPCTVVDLHWNFALINIQRIRIYSLQRGLARYVGKVSDRSSRTFPSSSRNKTSECIGPEGRIRFRVVHYFLLLCTFVTEGLPLRA